MNQNSSNLHSAANSKFQKHTNTKNDKINNTIIVGINKESIDLYERIQNYPALGYRVIGFISLKQIKKSFLKTVPFLGRLESLKKNIYDFKITTVLIAIDQNQQSFLGEIVKICSECKVKFHIIADVYETVYGHVIRDIYNDLFKYHEFELRRVVDLIGSIFLLIFLIPIFMIIALAIKIESSGSIFYSQLYIGKKGKPFRVYKFRSMAQDPELKTNLDITNVGNFLRKTRIDELPQLINIFKGDMSFIGPRIERPFFVESFKQQIPFYINRLKIKPGVMGWAQVKWEYDETVEDVKEKLAFDLFYINNRSVLLDIKILLLTANMIYARKRM